MNIKSIERESIPDTDDIMTAVTIEGVSSPCILTRLIIKAMGRPGIDNDLEFIGSGDRWLISWSQPELSLEETRELMTKTLRYAQQSVNFNS
ncbi:MAG: hypothetical protein MUE44_04625 [Oscillatoriaceae cyanobacterium Prado104]|nr:hypothetical protein [Oscillatoriaceae cyanobacterium Prado104]